MNTNGFRLSFAPLVILLAACSGSSSTVGTGSSGGGGTGASAPAALFDEPGGDATGDSIYGVWGGSMADGGVTFDTRWRFRENEITLTTRCTLRDGRESETVGVTSRARVSDDEITFLESKRDEKKTGDITCRVNAQPRTLEVCDDSAPEGFERDCFRREGTTLTIFGTSMLEKLELVKLSD